MQSKGSESVEHKHFVNNDREKFFKSGALFALKTH